MNENWRSIVGFEHDATGPDRLPAWTARPLYSAGVNLNREKRATIQTRGPHRAASDTKVLLSTYEVEWDFPLTSAMEYLLFALSCLGDAGRTVTVGSEHTFVIGRGKDPVRSHIYMDGVDGTHYKAKSCLLTDLTFNVDLIQQCRAEATFAARELELMGSAHVFGASVPASGRAATALDSLVTIGATQYPVFGWSVGFQRDASAGGLDEDSIASAWDGNLTPDIGGKVVCRCTSPDFDEALKGQRVDPITAVIQFLGGSVITMEFPRCILQADSKRVVSTELYEYALSWAATQPPDGDAATLTLEVA